MCFYFLYCICIIFLQSSDRKWIHLLPFDFKYRPFLLMRCLLLTTTHCTTFKDFFWIDVSYDLHIGIYFILKKVQNWKVLEYQFWVDAEFLKMWIYSVSTSNSTIKIIFRQKFFNHCTLHTRSLVMCHNQKNWEILNSELHFFSKQDTQMGSTTPLKNSQFFGYYPTYHYLILNPIAEEDGVMHRSINLKAHLLIQTTSIKKHMHANLTSE